MLKNKFKHCTYKEVLFTHYVFYYRLLKQFMSEKIGGVEGTKLNEEFMDMERKTDLTAELVDELITKTREYLQPNPATRSKMMLNAKIAQNNRTRNYAQPEGMLGETVLRIAHRFGEDSPYVRSLMETGEAFKQMAEIKYALEDDVRQDFIDPLTQLQSKELRDVLFHRKKLQGRRLDFDCKKRRKANGANIMDEEMKIAEEKFEESFNAASQGMHNLLQNDVEQISQLVAFVEALRDFYKSCGTVLEGLSDKLGALRDESAGRQHSQYIPKKLKELNLGQSSTGEGESANHIGKYQLDRLYKNTFYLSSLGLNLNLYTISLLSRAETEPAPDSNDQSPNDSGNYLSMNFSLITLLA